MAVVVGLSIDRASSVVSGDCRRLMDLANLEDGIFSQYHEDGVLIALLDILGTEAYSSSQMSKYYVEFGVENGVQCNTRVLRERMGFSGLSMDGGNSNSGINLHEEFVTEGNILGLLQKHSVPHNFDILSIDVDMFDLWIMSKILRDGTYKPRVIIVETNPTLCVNNFMTDYRKANSLPLVVTHPDLTNQTVWDSTRYSGANPKAFQMTADRFGYRMVHCERCGVNCFLVRKDVLPQDCSEMFDDHLPMVPYPCFGTVTPEGGTMIGHPLDPEERPAVMLDGDLLDVLTIPRGRGAEDLFSGLHHVNPSTMGYACGKGTSTSPRGWGGDWCMRIFSGTGGQDFGGKDRFDSASIDFYKGNIEAAFKGFSSLLQEEEQAQNLGPCVSSHSSESGCALRGKVSFNAAVSALNAAATEFREDPRSSGRYLALADQYIELALSFDQSDDHIRGVQQLVAFLRSDPDEVNQRLDKTVSVSMAIAKVADDGGDLVAKVEITSRDDVAAVTGELCGRYSVSPQDCHSIELALQSELRNAAFPYPLVPFDFTGSRKWSGLRSIPACLLHFPVVKLLHSL